MKQQMFKLLSRLARRQQHKLGHVFIRVARTRGDRTHPAVTSNLAVLEPKPGWPREGRYHPPFALNRSGDKRPSCCE